MRCIQVSPTSNTMHDRRQTRATQVAHFVSVRVYGEGLACLQNRKASAVWTCPASQKQTPQLASDEILIFYTSRRSTGETWHYTHPRVASPCAARRRALALKPRVSCGEGVGIEV